MAETVAEGRRRDFFGLNRAKHAVVEAAILATRVPLLPLEAIFADIQAAWRRSSRRQAVRLNARHSRSWKDI